MSLHNILIATGIVAAVGLIIAIVLSIAEKAFHVDVDEKRLPFANALPATTAAPAAMRGATHLQRQ